MKKLDADNFNCSTVDKFVTLWGLAGRIYDGFGVHSNASVGAYKIRSRLTIQSVET